MAYHRICPAEELREPRSVVLNGRDVLLTNVDGRPHAMEALKVALRQKDYRLRALARGKRPVVLGNRGSDITAGGGRQHAVDRQLRSVADDGLDVLDVDRAGTGRVENQLVEFGAGQGPVGARAGPHRGWPLDGGQGVGQAGDDGADYVILGPIFETPSKREFGAPLGLAALADACRRSSIPVFAIGGMTPVA